MNLTVLTTWLVVVCLEEISIFNKILYVRWTSECCNDTISRSIISDNHLSFSLIMFKDFHLTEFSITSYSIISVSCPFRVSNQLLNLSFLISRNCVPVALIVECSVIVTDISPWLAHPTSSSRYTFSAIEYIIINVVDAIWTWSHLNTIFWS